MTQTEFYAIFGIMSGIAIIFVLLLIVCDKNFVGYTRHIPIPPKHLKPKTK